jgi:hypothetical protein
MIDEQAERAGRVLCTEVDLCANAARHPHHLRGDHAVRHSG